jgi:hypothetical protein
MDLAVLHQPLRRLTSSVLLQAFASLLNNAAKANNATE